MFWEIIEIIIGFTIAIAFVISIIDLYFWSNENDSL